MPLTCWCLNNRYCVDYFKSTCIETFSQFRHFQPPPPLESLIFHTSPPKEQLLSATISVGNASPLDSTKKESDAPAPHGNVFYVASTHFLAS